MFFVNTLLIFWDIDYTTLIIVGPCPCMPSGDETHNSIIRELDDGIARGGGTVMGVQQGLEFNPLGAAGVESEGRGEMGATTDGW